MNFKNVLRTLVSNPSVNARLGTKSANFKNVMRTLVSNSWVEGLISSKLISAQISVSSASFSANPLLDQRN